MQLNKVYNLLVSNNIKTHKIQLYNITFLDSVTDCKKCVKMIKETNAKTYSVIGSYWIYLLHFDRITVTSARIIKISTYDAIGGYDHEPTHILVYC